MSNVAVRVDNVSKKFRKGEIYDSLRDLIPGLSKKLLKNRHGEMVDREFWALRDVSFEVKRGEVMGVIGRNGAGKSTLLKILSRITDPTAGRVAAYGAPADIRLWHAAGLDVEAVR